MSEIILDIGEFSFEEDRVNYNYDKQNQIILEFLTNILDDVTKIKLIEDSKELIRKLSFIDGYYIKTTEQVIFFGISNSQNCCETAGYLSVNDDIKEFINSKLLSIELITDKLEIIEYVKNKKCELRIEDALCHEHQVPERKHIHEFYDNCTNGLIFINIETSIGKLQLAVYNMHNGYYSHAVTIISNQLNHNIHI